MGIGRRVLFFYGIFVIFLFESWLILIMYMFVMNLIYICMFRFLGEIFIFVNY